MRIQLKNITLLLFVILSSSCAVLQERSLPISKVDDVKKHLKGKIKLEITYQQYQCPSSLEETPCKWMAVNSKHLNNSIHDAFKQFNDLALVDSSFDYKIHLTYKEKLTEGVRWYTFISLGLIPGKVQCEITIDVIIENSQGSKIKDYSFKEVYSFKAGFVYLFSEKSKSSAQISNDIDANIVNKLLSDAKSENLF